MVWQDRNWVTTPCFELPGGDQYMMALFVTRSVVEGHE